MQRAGRPSMHACSEKFLVRMRALHKETTSTNPQLIIYVIKCTRVAIKRQSHEETVRAHAHALQDVYVRTVCATHRAAMHA